MTFFIQKPENLPTNQHAVTSKIVWKIWSMHSALSVIFWRQHRL